MPKIGFVILHFMTIEDTVDCVESIEKHVTEDYEIVIVDNNSPNNSGIYLKQFYLRKERIHVILNNKNEGFARGNNIGFRYAKKELSCEYIILMNNDTCILNNDFCEKVKEIYEEKKYAVLGPQIITDDGIWKNNPQRLKSITYRDAVRHLCYHLLYFVTALLKLEDYVTRINLKRKKHKSENLKYAVDHENVQINGAFMIFSPIYVKKFNGLDSRTYMYGEEDILYAYILRYQLKSVYTTKIQILHKVSSATKQYKGIKNYKKNVWAKKNALKSCIVLIKVLMGNIDKETVENI